MNPQEDSTAQDLLSNSDTVQDVQIKASEQQPVTQVTSVAKEEARTGIKTHIPSAEELVARASSSMIVSTRRLEGLVESKAPGNKYKISRKGMNRVLLAILNLPTEGLPVELRGDEEKLAFALGQRLISDRFILMQHHINEEMKKHREQQSAATAETKQEGETSGH